MEDDIKIIIFLNGENLKKKKKKSTKINLIGWDTIVNSPSFYYYCHSLSSTVGGIIISKKTTTPQPPGQVPLHLSHFQATLFQPN
jgi:hypothetical protein